VRRRLCSELRTIFEGAVFVGESIWFVTRATALNGAGGCQCIVDDSQIHQPNDKLFKVAFSDAVNAAAFLKEHLPEDVAAVVDWESLQLESSSFVDPEMASSESDLLFKARFGEEEGLVYVLFEHQSTEDARMAFRILRYMVRIWEREVAQAVDAPLRPVLPVVLAQGAKAWRVSERFQNLFELGATQWGALRRYVPDFVFQLIQLAELPYDKIRGTPFGILTMRALKAEPLGELLREIVWDEELFVRVPVELVERLLRYIYNADIDTHDFRARLSLIRNNSLKTNTMTLADRLKQEGREEGREEGRGEGLSRGRVVAMQQMLAGALAVRFQNVPIGMVEALDDIKSPERLQALLPVAVKCESIKEFARHL